MDRCRKCSILMLLVIVFACIVGQNRTLAAPVLRIPLFADDTYISGPAGALLASFVSEVVNQEAWYPFTLDLDVHFVYTSGPEGFYEANKVANASRPVALMGPDSSSPAQLLSTVGDVYNVPIMAYWATSPYLSSKDAYPHIWRAVSSDAIRVGAWVDFCVAHQWAHVVVIEESSLYGRGLAEYFSVSAAEAGILATRFKLKSYDDLPRIMTEIKATNIEIVVAALSNTIIEVMGSAVEYSLIGPTSGYVWLFGDAVSDLFPLYTEYSGSMTVLDPNEALIREFNKTEYSSLIDVAYSKVEASFNSVDEANNPFRVGTPARVSISEAKALMWTAGALPCALVRALLSICEAASSFYKANGALPNSEQMSSLLHQFSMTILDEQVEYGESQEVTATTVGMVNMRLSDPFYVVGSWTPETGVVMNQNEHIFWPDGSTVIPDDGIALETYYKHTNVFSVFVIVISAILCAAFIVTFGLTIKFFYTPVFRLASPYSLSVILAGLFLVTFGSGFYLDRPSRTRCRLRYGTYYVGLTLAYSALAAKTWRVWMVFKASNSLKKGIAITNMRLLVYTALLTAPAILLTILRTSISDDVDMRKLSNGKDRVDVVCQSKHPWWSYIQQSYVGVQMLATCILAWKTRKVPTGFNEAKHVFISVYIACTIGIVGFISAGALERTIPKLANALFLFSMLIVAAVMWGALFIPKLYIALLRPDLNTRELMRQKVSEKRITDDDYHLTESVGIEQSAYEPNTEY